MWYAFEANNAETRYGWTSDDRVSAAVVARLNEGREINLFTAQVLGDDRDDLADRNDLVCTDGSRPEDFK